MWFLWKWSTRCIDSFFSQSVVGRRSWLTVDLRARSRGRKRRHCGLTFVTERTSICPFKNWTNLRTTLLRCPISGGETNRRRLQRTASLAPPLMRVFFSRIRVFSLAKVIVPPSYRHSISRSKAINNVNLRRKRTDKRGKEEAADTVRTKERDDERWGTVGKKEQDEEAAKRSTERRLTRCVWAALPASIRRHLKCVHVHSQAHARTHAYNEMSADRPLCSAFAKMAGISSPRPAKAAAQESDKKRPIAKCLWVATTATINDHRAKIILCFHLVQASFVFREIAVVKCRCILSSIKKNSNQIWVSI